MGGNYDDILNMCYWDYLTILDSVKRQNNEASGKPFVLNNGELPESSKHMIEKRKKRYG